MREKLVLVPGLVCDAAVWQHQSSFLRDLAEPIIPAVTEGETISDMARIALEEAPDRFALAGFSMGGYVALEMLRQAPQRVQRLALLDTSARRDPPEKAAWRQSVIAACQRGEYAKVISDMIAILLHPEHQQGKLADFVKQMAARVGADVYARRQAVIAGRPDSRDLLKATNVPVRAILGRQDAMSTLEAHAEIAELAPRGRLSVIEECGHMTILERPQAATALLRDWLIYD